jgi:hypothetical protein
MIDKTDIEDTNKKVVISTILQAQTFTSLKKLCGKKYLHVSGCSAGGITGTTEEKKQQILNLIINHLFPGSQQELVKISKPKQKKVSGDKTITDLKNQLKEKGITKNITKLTNNKKDNLQKLLTQQRCNKNNDYSTCPKKESCFIENKLCVDQNIDKVGSLERRPIIKQGKTFYVLSTKKEAENLQDKILIDEATDSEDEDIQITKQISRSESESGSESESEEEEESARLILFRQEGMTDVAGDGNCLFTCISKLLKICYDVDVSYNTCRQQICDMLVILFGMYPDWVKTLEDQSPEEYIEQMRQESEWGGEHEIIAICVLYNVSINISYEQENTPNYMFENINKEYKIRDQQFHDSNYIFHTPIWGLYHTGVVDNSGTHYQYNTNVYSTNIQFNNSSFNGTNCSSLPYNKLNTQYINQYYNHLISKIEQTYSPDRFQSPSPIAYIQSTPSSPVKPAPRYATFGSPPTYNSPEIISPTSSIGSIHSYVSPDSPIRDFEYPMEMAYIQSSPSPPQYDRPASPIRSPVLNPEELLMTIDNEVEARNFVKQNFPKKEGLRMFQRWKGRKGAERYEKPKPIVPKKKTGQVSMRYPSTYRRFTPEEVLEIPRNLSPEMNVSQGLQEELEGGGQDIENIEEVNEKVTDIMSGLSEQFS